MIPEMPAIVDDFIVYEVDYYISSFDQLGLVTINMNETIFVTISNITDVEIPQSILNINFIKNSDEKDQ